MTTPPLKDRAGQAEDLATFLRNVADNYPTVDVIDLQSSDQGYYGFTVQAAWENDGCRSDYHQEIIQENEGINLLSDLDWQGVVGEDKTGHASFNLEDYRTYITVQIPKDDAQHILGALDGMDARELNADNNGHQALRDLYRTLTQALGV